MPNSAGCRHLPLGSMFTELVAVPLMKVSDPRQQVGRHQQCLPRSQWVGSPAGRRGVGCRRRLQTWSFTAVAGANKQGRELQQVQGAAGMPIQQLLWTAEAAAAAASSSPLQTQLGGQRQEQMQQRAPAAANCTGTSRLQPRQEQRLTRHMSACCSVGGGCSLVRRTARPPARPPLHRTRHSSRRSLLQPVARSLGRHRQRLAVPQLRPGSLALMLQHGAGMTMWGRQGDMPKLFPAASAASCCERSPRAVSSSSAT